ncbi:MAG TPA: VOC family protein [Solirubrobacterales bacterium]|nr:VOC family protein [Solirubrobacterales bacterium]
MSERNGYEHGVPCWVDTWREDATATARFYGEILGWDLAGLEEDGAEKYVIGQLRGRDVAAIGSPKPPAARGLPTAWTTYVWVDDADETAARVEDAGGTVLAEPFDSLDGGRMTIVADREGATIGAWHPGEHRGAELVNEPGAWAMSSLSSRDPEGAADFYGAVFGWETESFGPAVMFRLPGYVGGEPSQPVPRDVIATMMPLGNEVPADLQACWDVDFWVADVEAVAKRTTELGGRVISQPAEVPGVPMKEGVIADPDGATLSVTQLLLPG